MLDAALDGLAEPHQKVSFTLNNLKSLPIVLERVTLHYGGETPTSGAPFESESTVLVGAGQEVVFAKYTKVPNPVSYVELNFVKYADGSSWQPSAGEVCKIIPDPLKKITVYTLFSTPNRSIRLQYSSRPLLLLSTGINEQTTTGC
jgi:hypothetical protein